MSITHDRGKTAVPAIDEDADRIPEGNVVCCARSTSDPGHS
jgi:hypothetical protein